MTIPSQILDYLKAQDKFVPGGKIEDYIRMVDGAKGDTTSRRLREMTEDGLIICEKLEVNGRKFVHYALPDKQMALL